MLAETWKILTQARLGAEDDFSTILPAWQRLSARSLSPAGLNSPEIVIPLIKHVGGAELLTVQQGDELLFAMPVIKRKFPRGLLAHWVTPLTPVGTPHVCNSTPATALSTMLGGLMVPLMMPALETTGAFWNYASTRDAHFKVIDRYERAALRPNGSFGQWMDQNFSAKRRKEYKRLQSRLAEAGRFEQQELASGEDAATWIDDLMSLEAAGWKGERGTALASNAKLRQAAREALCSLATTGKLRMWRLTLDGRTIATMHAVAEGSRLWLGKMAYDEKLAKFSPGALLILHVTERIFAAGGIELADSCAIPNHPMINNIWRDRVEVADVMIAPRSISAAHFSFMVQLERLRRTTRVMARDTYNYFTGRRAS
jgi:CelD/BcsL family acetyltransferase involved in cellulose biosynthesis